jgi:hypothetical protein
VNYPWDETAIKLDEAAALEKRAVILGDADREMRKALVEGERNLSFEFIPHNSDTFLFYTDIYK